MSSDEHNKLEYFRYELPQNRIAQTPIEPRDSARMLTYLNHKAEHKVVTDLVSLLKSGDLLVVNDTKVRPARLNLNKETGGKAEVLLLDPTGKPNEWQALIKPAKRLPPGTVLLHDGEPAVEVVDVIDERRLVRLIDPDLVEAMGELPLPPYIKEKLQDQDRYQTVYANRVGSAAAPTAGLHLTDELLEKLESKGVELARVELQVGLGTFKPIDVEDLADHQMHTETYNVSEQVWAQIKEAKRVVAVGTTVVRTLESAASTGQLSGETSLFINRDFNWKVIDLLLTNFHVPESSLLVLVDSFVGPVWKDLYAEALAEEYRFLSFGDCMLLERGDPA